MTYVMSDIHGRYDLYKKMLVEIEFSSEDTLYILGDIVDRGPEPIKILLDVMEKYNIVCLPGNHEFMMVRGINSLKKEKPTDDDRENILEWKENGGDTTIDELSKYDQKTINKVMDFICEMDIFEEITVNDKGYILVHAGLGNFSPDKDMYDYEYDEFVWMRADYNTQYFPDKYVISGHTPTQCIKGNDRGGYIFRKNNHIAIDCGAGSPYGRLACLCLDTDKEFYLECTE